VRQPVEAVRKSPEKADRLETNVDLARPSETVLDARAWTRVLARYRNPSNARSMVEIGITVVPLVLLWLLMWATLGVQV